MSLTQGSVELSPLSAFQTTNRLIYQVQNDRNYSTSDIVSRLHHYATYVLKSARKKKTDRIAYHLSMAFSWSMALANRLHVSIEDELWKRYPGVCPYCRGVVCVCGTERPAERCELGEVDLRGKPATLAGLQAMFARIYPSNTLESSAAHLAEELGELDEAVEYYAGTHREDLFDDIVVELIDVVANICAVATCASVHLAEEVSSQFTRGCPKCFHWPCTCGFTTAKSVPIR